MFPRLRFAALFLASVFALTSCGGGGASRLFSGGGSSNGTGPGLPTGVTGGKANVQFTLTIPSSAGTKTASAVRKPATISSDTQSLTVSVNGGTPQIFNAAPPTCTTTTPVTCALSIGAPVGLDSFLIITWSGPNGTGTALNAAAVTLSVSSTGPNTAAATAGNLITVNSSADGSGGSFSCASSSSTCTLREAIAEASTTAGVYTAVMFASSVSAINLSGSNGPITIDGQNIIILGPGATAANSGGVGAPAAAGNLTISGSNATQIFLISSGTFLVDGVTLANGSSSSYGGAIQNSGGSLAIVNTILSGNSPSNSYGYGGAVEDDGSVPSTIVASTFQNNAAEYGGAYDDENSAGVSFNLSSFSNNVAYSSGDAYGAGGAIYTEANLSVNASTFTSNVAGSSTVAGTSGTGGAIAIEGGSASPVISNSTFGGSSSSAGNLAGGAGPNDDGYGGAVDNAGDYALTSTGNTFADNVARGGDYTEGGAIADDNCVGIVSTSDTFTSNSSDSSASGATGDANAGAVYVCGASTVTGGTLTSNQSMATTNGYAEGGAFYTDGTPVTVSGSTFSKNSASGGGCDGGAVFSYDDVGDFITLSNVQITSNTCTATGSSGSFAAGGGLEIDYAFLTFTNVTISGNTADASQTGGSSYAIGGGFAWYDGDYNNGCGNGCATSRRPAPQVASRPKPAISRAKLVAALHSRRTQSRSRIQTIKQRHPSHLARHATSTGTRVASVRRSPKISVGSGSTMNSVTFSNNTANGGTSGTAYGGGADLSGNPIISTATFNSNTVTASGPNAYAAGGGFSLGSYDGNGSNCGYVSMTGSTVSNNSATNAGGGIWAECNLVFGTYGTVSNNSVTAVANEYDGGGGIWNDDTLEIYGFTFNANTVSGSTASTGGGAIMNYDGGAFLTNSTFYKNTASVDGGGIENIYESELELVNSTIYQNTAGHSGGNVNNDPSPAGPGTTTVFSGNTIIAGGTATSGPDIWNIDTFTSAGYNVVQQSSNFGTGTSNVPQTGDLIGQDPLLASGLASNGGPTQTIADTSSSPGRAHIPFSSGSCNGAPFTSIDQRIFTRGSGGACDVGAYELSGTQDTSPPVISPGALKRKL